MNESAPRIAVVIPCYNESKVLPFSVPLFSDKIDSLIERGTVSEESFILFVDDGSSDTTWDLIREASASSPHVEGVSLSRNRGHQNALLCGLHEVIGRCDAAISVDCDGQDDIEAIDEMVEAFLGGSDVVYGVRSSRQTDTIFKRFTAEAFYSLMRKMDTEVVFNHADYRLMSQRALVALSEYQESNLFLRGIIPTIGFPSSTVEYERAERISGESHYPLRKMINLAVDGITSFSTKPIRLISLVGVVMGVLGILGIIWALVSFFTHTALPGWTSTLCVIILIGGIQLFSLGIIGEYIGRIYIEVKKRPRWIVGERTYETVKPGE